jgi:ferredoxin
MTRKFITQQELALLVGNLLAAHTRVIAPVRDEEDPRQVDYKPIESFSQAVFGAAIPRRSMKEFFLPITEVLLSYKLTHEGVKITEVPTQAPPQVIFGALPCDAAGLKTVDKVMNWDYRDELWFGRREASTIVTFLCSVMDHTCFCTAVGLGPEDSKGSDAMLIPYEGGYIAQLVTERGEKLFEGVGTAATEIMISASEDTGKAARAKVEPNLPAIPGELSEWLKQNFNHPVWKTIALRCHGCSACAALCPTCHCFDITDEHTSAEAGTRRRNWDSCQTSTFTVHASGHNPRASQSERFRQRIQHKFSVYPSRFGEMLCTGCGRCSRVCPGGMDLPTIVGELVSLAKSESEVSGQ